MKDFFAWLTDEKLIAIGVIVVALIAASYQEWATAGMVVSGGFGYLKGRSDEKANTVG